MHDVALCLSLKTPTGLNAIEITVDVDLQEHCGVIGGPSRCCWLDAFKTQFAEIQFIDEHIDHSNRVGISNIVIEACRQQKCCEFCFRLEQNASSGYPITR